MEDGALYRRRHSVPEGEVDRSTSEGPFVSDHDALGHPESNREVVDSAAVVVEQDDDQVFAAALEGAMAFPATVGEMATRVEAVALRTGQTPDTEPELIPATGQETSQVELRELRERVGHLAQQNRELRLQMEAMAPSSRSTGEGSGSVSRAERLRLENPNLMYMNSDMDPTGNGPEQQVRGGQPNLGGGVSDVSHDLLDLGEGQARMIGDRNVQQAATLPGLGRCSLGA